MFKKQKALKEIISSESKLLENIIKYLIEKLNNFVNRTSTQSLFKLDLCINSQNLTIIEPIVSFYFLIRLTLLKSLFKTYNLTKSMLISIKKMF